MEQELFSEPNNRPTESRAVPIEIVSSSRPKKREIWLPAILLLLTSVTTLIAGFLFHIQFASGSQQEFINRLSRVFSHPSDLLDGVGFAAGILLILLAHEMGHYLACRYYGINATLPYVIPAPPPIVPFGTFGAVIRIRSMFRDLRQLFDVGIAGPLAGFVFILPALIVGVLLSNEFASTEGFEGAIQFGEPLLFQFAVSLLFDGNPYLLNLHPLGWAAWFGMLATSLNLLPIGQLDGGHVVYAIFGEKGHRISSYITFVSLVMLSLLSWPMLGYMLFAAILLILRLRHPRPYIIGGELGRKRYVIAVIGLVIFVLTFIPVPVRFIEQTGSL